MGWRVNFQWRTTHFPLQSLTMYFPNIRKPANKEASNYQERRRDYKKVWLTEKNSGMMWKWGRLWEATTKSRWYTCPPGLKHRPEEHPEASATVWRNLKLQGGFWIHVTPNSTTILPRLWPEPKISTPKSKHVLKVSCAVLQSSGTSTWVYKSELSERPPSSNSSKSTHTPVFSRIDCTLIRGKPNPQK